jgi:tetratricopeptide (TPR) repeat protein
LARVQLGDHQQALGDFTLALGLDATDTSLRLQRGQTYLACQAYQLAARDFDQVLQRKPSNAEAYHGRGLARLVATMVAANDPGFRNEP